MEHQIHKIPPQSIETEESILAHCMLCNEGEAVETLTSEDFYSTAHKTIWDHVCKLSGAQKPVDLLTLTDSLRDAGDLERVGGASRLAQLIDGCPVASNVGYYTKILKDKATLRKLIELSSETMQQCFDSGGDVECVLDEAQKKIVSIDYGSSETVEMVGDTLERVIEQAEQAKPGEITGVPTGISRIDLLLGGLQPSANIVVAARPSMGKTALALNIARHASISCDMPGLFFSLEMSIEELTKRLIAMIGRVDGGKFLTNTFFKDDWKKINEAAGIINNAPLFVDDRPGLTYLEVKRTLRKMIKRHGIKYAIIDYLQLMQGDKENGRTGEVGSISRAIKGMAKEFKIPIVALSQLNRKLEERRDKRPMLSDLRDSGEIEQDADVVMFIYRDEVYNKDENNPHRGTAEILVEKHRSGATGLTKLAFLKCYQRFEDLAYHK